MTADMAYRRPAPAQAGGFDQRFARAFREDADLALRIRDQGWTLHRGNRKTTNPVRPAGPWASLRARVAGRDRRVRGAAHPPWPRAPQAPRHIPAMTATSALTPPLAAGHWLHGHWLHGLRHWSSAISARTRKPRTRLRRERARICGTLPGEFRGFWIVTFRIWIVTLCDDHHTGS
jgi:hypothetical protein